MKAPLSPPKDFSLSSVMPNYNHGKHIGEAINAVVTQSLRPTELIVVDDCSTDNSVEIISEFVRKDPIVKLLRNEKNMGPVYTLDRGLKAAKGDYIYGGGADDKILPGFFEKSIALLRKYPQAGLCLSEPANFDSVTGALTETPLFWAETPRYFSPADLAATMSGSYIPGISNIARREAFEEAGGYGYPELKWHSDWFLWQVIGLRYGICYLPECLAAQRVEPGSYSSSGRRAPADQRKVIRYILSLIKSPQFRDILPVAAQASIMSHFGEEAVNAVMEEQEFWDQETMMLIQEPLWRWNIRLQHITSERRERSVKEFKARGALSLANTALQEDKPEDALKILMDLVGSFPSFIRGYIKLAEVSAMCGQREAAITVLNSAVKLDPQNIIIRTGLGILYEETGDHERARREFEAALKIDPTHEIAKEGEKRTSAHQMLVRQHGVS